MNGLLIALAIIAGVVLLILLPLVFGRAGIHIICRGEVRVTVSVFGVRFRIYPKKPKKERPLKDLTRVRNPEKALKRMEARRRRSAEKAIRKKLKLEQKKLRRERKKKEKVARAAPVPTPNLKENLGMILSIVKGVYRKSKGKIRIRVFRMHLQIGGKDAAQTALLYGATVQATAYLLEWIETHFSHIRRESGDMTVTPDFVSGTTKADIDITLSLRLWNGLRILLHTLKTYRFARATARRKAAKRILKQRGKVA